MFSPAGRSVLEHRGHRFPHTCRSKQLMNWSCKFLSFLLWELLHSLVELFKHLVDGNSIPNCVGSPAFDYSKPSASPVSLLQPVICVQLLNVGNWEIGLEVHCLVEVDNGCIDLVDEQVHLWQKMNWTKNTEILDAHVQPGLCDGRCQHCQDQVPQRRQSQQNSAGDPCLGPAVDILVERCFERICCYTITFQGCSMDILHLALLNK